jgi:hypothetical protein
MLAKHKTPEPPYPFKYFGYGPESILGCENLQIRYSNPLAANEARGFGRTIYLILQLYFCDFSLTFAGDGIMPNWRNDVKSGRPMTM